MHLDKRDCKLATFWPPDQEKCTYYASVILNAREHLLFQNYASIICQGLVLAKRQGEHSKCARSLVPRPSHHPVLDHLQYAKTEGKALSILSCELT